MKGKAAKTGFDGYFSGRMVDRGFATAYERARTGINSVDRLLRLFEDGGGTKAKTNRKQMATARAAVA